ncbi:hypothetical protein [Glycomyces paridis]|uniref:Uncharacterized protein n=1 Tax=Glycomyces paridis TaxID=2126555 RepID=A0A4S8PEX5_9ACTN|nr:hypothetical protein [Glycomyces paridis]THV28967.1 hypothetical protein E9998_09425 [Glycomyces paridis]
MSRPFQQRGNLFGDGPRRRRFAIPDSPAVAVVTAAVTLALAVLLLVAAMPGEERVLVYEGQRVSPTALCETVDEEGEKVMGACVELGEFETRPTGWSVLPLAVAAVLAGLAAVVLAGVPKQLRERRSEEAARLERMTDEDFKGL